MDNKDEVVKDINGSITPLTTTISLGPSADAQIYRSRRSWNAWDGWVPWWIRFFCFFWQTIKFMLQFVLCWRQLYVLNTRLKIPRVLKGKLSPQTFEKAREYQKELVYLEAFSCFYYIGYEWWAIFHAGQTKLWFLAGPILDWLDIWPDDWDQETGETIVFIVEFITLGHLLSLPLDLWKIFIIEEKYGFNRMTFSAFLTEWFKVDVLESGWTVVAGVAVLWIVRETGSLFFLWVWAFCLVWLVLSVAVYPNFVAPMFNDYTKLREGRLRQRLKRLAKYIGFKLEDILVLHQSWKSAHRDAIFFGFGASKRIVLYDTILEGYPEADKESKEIIFHRRPPHTPTPREHVFSNSNTPSRILEFSDPSLDRLSKSESYAKEVGIGVAVGRSSMSDLGFYEHEIEALVAKLMGHWVLNHSFYELITPIVSLFLFFFIFSYCYQASSLFQAFELPRGMDKPIILGLRLLYCDVMDVYKIMVDAAMKYFARNRELEADSFATRLNYGDDLIDALIQLNKENLGFPYSDYYYWIWNNSEPSLLQRIEAIEQEIRRMEWRFYR